MFKFSVERDTFVEKTVKGPSSCDFFLHLSERAFKKLQALSVACLEAV